MIQSVERALAILVLVADGKGAPVSLKEISERTGLHRSTCAHLLETLAETGFVHQISRNEGFVLGAYAYYLTRYRVFRQELLQVCNPVLQWLHRQTGCTALLAILESQEKFNISCFEQEDGLLHARGELFLGNLYTSATGRVLLAHMPDASAAALVRKVGLPPEAVWREAQSLPQLLAELAQIRKREYIRVDAVVDGCPGAQYGAYVAREHEPGAAVGLFLPHAQAANDAQDGRTIAALMRAVREISRRLRFEL